MSHLIPRVMRTVLLIGIAIEIIAIITTGLAGHRNRGFTGYFVGIYGG